MSDMTFCLYSTTKHTLSYDRRVIIQQANVARYSTVMPESCIAEAPPPKHTPLSLPADEAGRYFF